MKKATRQSYKAPTTKKGTRYYYCVVTRGKSKVTSRVVKVTVR